MLKNIVTLVTYLLNGYSQVGTNTIENLFPIVGIETVRWKQEIKREIDPRCLWVGQARYTSGVRWAAQYSIQQTKYIDCVDAIRPSIIRAVLQTASSIRGWSMSAITEQELMQKYLRIKKKSNNFQSSGFLCPLNNNKLYFQHCKIQRIKDDLCY